MASTTFPITLVSMGEWLFGAEERLLERQEGSTSSRALQFTQHRAECRGTSLLIRHTSFFPPNIFSSPFPIGVTFSAAKSHCFCPFTAFPRFICSRGVPKLPRAIAEHHYLEMQWEGGCSGVGGKERLRQRKILHWRKQMGTSTSTVPFEPVPSQ